MSEAVKLVHRAYLFDNSGKSQNLVIEVQDGQFIKIHNETIPVWIEQHLLKKI